MPKVHVIQETKVRDRETGEYRLAFDLAPAAMHGDIDFMLPAGMISLATTPMMKTLRQKMSKYEDGDFILPTGDPVAIFAAGMAHALSNPHGAKLLKWDKRQQDYIILNLTR